MTHLLKPMSYRNMGGSKAQLLANVYSTEEYTAVIFECIETLKPKLVTVTPLHRKLKTTTCTFYYRRRHKKIGHNQLYNELVVTNCTRESSCNIIYNRVQIMRCCGLLVETCEKIVNS